MKIRITVDYSITHETEVDIDLSKFDLNDLDAIDCFLIEEAIKSLPPGEVVGWGWDDSVLDNS